MLLRAELVSLFWSHVSHCFHLLVCTGVVQNSFAGQGVSGHLPDLSGHWITAAPPLPCYSSSSLWKHSSKPVSEVRINIKDNKTLTKYFEYSQRRWGKSKGRGEPRAWRNFILQVKTSFSPEARDPEKVLGARDLLRSVHLFIRWKIVKAGSEYLAELIPILPSAHLQSCRRVQVF